jgi:hypothetical protein
MKRDRKPTENGIISIQKHEKNYSLIDNVGLRDSVLSFKATGLWAFLISHPPDWQVNVNHLVNAKADGRDSVLSGLCELYEEGYLLYLKWRSTDGTFSSRYIVFESSDLKEKYLNQMSEDDRAKVTAPYNPKSRTKNKSEAITGNPIWSENEKTITGNPQRETPKGKPEQTNNIYTNDELTNDLSIKDPLTPQGGTGLFSQDGNGENLTGGGEERSPNPTEPPQAIQQGAPVKTKSCSEDQTSAAPTPIYSVHKKEHQARIVAIYQANKPTAWQPVSNLHRAIRVMVDGLLSSEDFQGDLEAFLTRLENALFELNDPTSKFGWFRSQGNLGITTLLSNYGKHLMEFSNAWTERQNPQIRSTALPDWALEAQKEIEARQTKKAG